MDGKNNENLLIINVNQSQMMNVIKSLPFAVLTKILILIYYLFITLLLKEKSEQILQIFIHTNH